MAKKKEDAVSVPPSSADLVQTTPADIAPAQPAAVVSLIDLLHDPEAPHRFTPGDLVRALIIGTDPVTKAPAVLVHRLVETSDDRIVKIVSASPNEGRYVAELQPLPPAGK